MGNAMRSKVLSRQNCCAKGVCSPQPELLVSEYVFEPQAVRLQKSGRFDPSQSKELSVIRESLVTDHREASVDLPRLQQVVDSAPVLHLKVLSSNSLSRDSVISLTALGYPYSPRHASDGHTYFGCVSNNESQLDFFIPDGHTAGQHFLIYFDLVKEAYFISDLGVGFGTFLKIDGPLQLKTNYLILLGANFALVSFADECLELKLFGVEETKSVYTFEPRPETPITIGRKAKCDVQLNDSLASKVQVTIQFSSFEDCVLCDGQPDRPSTNGTWLYLSESHEIRDGMVFKAMHTLFETRLEPSVT